MVETSHNLVRTTHQPEKLPKPVFPANVAPWQKQPLWFLEVVHDAPAALFRAWYNVKNPGGHRTTDGTGMGTPYICYAYAESPDGMSWRYPDLGLVAIDGSTKNNLIDAPLDNFGLFMVDDGPGVADGSRRFKMAYFRGGLSVAFSADGMRFQPFAQNPVIHQGRDGSIISDIIDGSWDPLKHQYLLGCKIEKDGYPGKPHHHNEGWRRCVGVSVSQDFITWSKPELIVTPDPNNGIEEFYGFKPMVRGNLYIGFLRVLRDDLPATPDGPVEGIGWTERMTSRDGKKWTRYQEKFLDRNLANETWDHAMAWFGACVPVGDIEYIYYGGYNVGHKPGDRAVGLGFLRQNGFVSRDAGENAGSLRTPLLVIDGSVMTVNAKVEGELRVRLTDRNGTPLPGFDWSDGEPVKGDSVRHPLKWSGGDLKSVRGTPVRLEFRLHKAQLYAVDVTLKADDPKPAGPETAPGVTGQTKSPLRLRIPPDAPKGDTIHYGLPRPVQLGPKTAAVFVSRHLHEKEAGDYVADGQWHCLLGYRVMRNDIFSPRLAPEIVHKVSGGSVEEIQSCGAVQPVWNFAE